MCLRTIFFFMCFIILDELAQAQAMTPSSLKKNELKEACYLQIDQDIYPGNILMTINQFDQNLKIIKSENGWNLIQLLRNQFWVDSTCLNTGNGPVYCPLYFTQDSNENSYFDLYSRHFNIVRHENDKTLIELKFNQGYMRTSCFTNFEEQQKSSSSDLSDTTFIAKAKKSIPTYFNYSFNAGTIISQFVFNQSSISDFSFNKMSTLGYSLTAQTFFNDNQFDLIYSSYRIPYDSAGGQINQTDYSAVLTGLYQKSISNISLLFKVGFKISDNPIFIGKLGRYTQDTFKTHNILIGSELTIPYLDPNLKMNLNYLYPWSTDSSYKINQSTYIESNIERRTQVLNSLAVIYGLSYRLKQYNLDYSCYACGFDSTVKYTTQENQFFLKLNQDF